MKTTHLTPTVWLGFAALSASAWAQPAVPASAAAAPAPAAAGTAAPAARSEGGLRFNFRGAPLETVLNYMSEAAGYVIVLETPVRGNVDMWSTQPVSKEEAVQLLNVALNKNGYSATAQGRTLIVTSKDDAKKRNIPIRTGNSADEIPANADMFMQIIPLRRIDATQAARDLGTLLPGSSTITANADSNSLVVTDTNLNLKHVVELVSALDGSMDTVSTVKIFKLENADPYEMAQLLTNLYASPSQGTSGRTGQSTQGRGGFPGGAGFNPAAAIAAAMAGRGGGGGNRTGGGGGGGSTTTNRSVPVVAVADPRTFSVIVTAAKEVMPDITEMVAQLDTSSARKQKVFVYTMENANVKQVEAILKNLFQSQNSRASTTTQPDPLTTRATTNAQTSNANRTLGSIGGGRSN